MIFFFLRFQGSHQTPSLYPELHLILIILFTFIIQSPNPKNREADIFCKVYSRDDRELWYPFQKGCCNIRADPGLCFCVASHVPIRMFFHLLPIWDYTCSHHIHTCLRHLLILVSLISLYPRCMYVHCSWEKRRKTTNSLLLQQQVKGWRTIEKHMYKITMDLRGW